jgi:hypothetical protein
MKINKAIKAFQQSKIMRGRKMRSQIGCPYVRRKMGSQIGCPYVRRKMGSQIGCPYVRRKMGSQIGCPYIRRKMGSQIGCPYVRKKWAPKSDVLTSGEKWAPKLDVLMSGFPVASPKSGPWLFSVYHKILYFSFNIYLRKITKNIRIVGLRGSNHVPAEHTT